MRRMHTSRIAGIILLMSALLGPSLAPAPDSGQAWAVETAPRITDREIIEALAELKAGQHRLDQRMDQLEKRMDQRFDDLNRRLDMLQWMFGLFITIVAGIFAAVARTLWSLGRVQAAHEKVNESLTTEITSLKETDLRLMDQIKALIEHLKPPPHL